MKNFVWKVEKKGSSPIWQEEKIPKIQEGEILISSKYSSINYKDALGFTGKGKIYRKYPIVPGIDVSGIVEDSKSSKFKKGDKVLVNGTGLGEDHNGGYAHYVKVPASDVVKLPEGLTTKEAMTIGTAGFTAALALHRMESLGQKKLQGKVLVTGASGGVGSFACLLLSKKGYDVFALSGKENQHEYLKKLGAKEVQKPEDLELGDRPLEKARFSGVIDNVGGKLLSKLISHIDLYGSIASIGLAGGHEIKTTVMPFILRGVSLIGVSSNNCPMDLRNEIWQDLAKTLNKEDFDKIQTEEIDLEKIDKKMPEFFQRNIVGRLLVKIK